MQIPMILLRENCPVGYRELFEAFSEGPLDNWPIVAEVRQFFVDKARDIQNGGAEYCRSDEWLNIWWPTDEFIFIKLVKENKLEAFYEEAEELLLRHLKRRHIDFDAELLRQSVRLNASLIKKPFQTQDMEVETSWNIWEYYRSVPRGTPIPLEETPRTYHIDRTSVRWNTWDDWYREVVWYGNKKGAYLYASNAVERQIAGHF